MSWYGDLYDSASESIGDLAGDYLSVKSDEIREDFTPNTDTTENKQPQTAGRTYQNAFGFNWSWQKAGVIIAALGVSVAAYKLVK